jgi:cytochrome b561
MALYMVDIPGITPTKLRLFNYHKWLGVCLWLFVLARLCWRYLSPPPALPDSVPGLQRRLAAIGHAGLYTLMLLIPILGYAYSLAAGYPVVLFGVLELPVFMAADPELKPVLKTLHKLANQLLWVLLTGHVLAALKHALFDRDGIMQRMLPVWFVR